MNMSKEPVLTTAAIVTLIGALLAMLGTFGVAVSDAQQESVKDFVTIAWPFAAAAWGIYLRRRVVSPNSAGEAVALAKLEPPGSVVVPDVKVPGYRDAVTEKLDVPENDINWKPKVSAQ